MRGEAPGQWDKEETSSLLHWPWEWGLRLGSSRERGPSERREARVPEPPASRQAVGLPPLPIPSAWAAPLRNRS